MVLVRPRSAGPILVMFGMAHLIICVKLLPKFPAPVFILWSVMIATDRQTRRYFFDYRDADISTVEL
jgi:hypothetical protein